MAVVVLGSLPHAFGRKRPAGGEGPLRPAWRLAGYRRARPEPGPSRPSVVATSLAEHVPELEVRPRARVLAVSRRAGRECAAVPRAVERAGLLLRVADGRD